MSYHFRGITVDDEILESLNRYVEHGVPTGGFLEAVIDNDLKEAIARADERRMPMIPAIVAYLYNHCDMRCWGHKGAFREWIQKKREEREINAL